MNPGSLSVGIDGLPATAVRTGAEIAEEAIRAAILDGRLAPGSELREAALGAQLGLSRTPIREALLALEGSGLVEMTRGRVARVSSRTPEELMDSYEVRAAVEGLAARLGAARLSDEVIRRLWESCERFERLLETEDASVLVKENQFFHGLIHANCGNSRIQPIARQLTELPLVYTAYAWYTADRRMLSHTQHCALTEAIEQRDQDAAQRIMEQHIRDAGAAALDVVRGDSRDF